MHKISNYGNLTYRNNDRRAEPDQIGRMFVPRRRFAQLAYAPERFGIEIVRTKFFATRFPQTDRIFTWRHNSTGRRTNVFGHLLLRRVSHRHWRQRPGDSFSCSEFSTEFQVSKETGHPTIRNLLKQAGLRCTSARTAVLQVLMDAGAPLTHAEVASVPGLAGLDRATVFRNLTDLTDAGLLTRTELGDHVWRFEIRDQSKEQHPHFVCVDCGAVSCLGEMKFTDASRRRSVQIGRITEILIKGQCAACVR